MPLNNPNDPLLKSGPEVERELFEAFTKQATGHDQQIVAGVAVNLLVNVIRQSCATREAAERAFDELFGRAKNLLLTQHYDPVTNKRRNVFPFTQHIHAQTVNWGDNI